MAGYLNQNGNSIGSLLRFIQEQKSVSPINPQSSEVGSPLRDIVQEPLKGSEGMGTNRVVSIRPEGTLTPSGQPIEQGAPQSSRIGPISIGGQGDVTQTPTNVVAANEPGPGISIPSATKTVGDVVNKTGAASEIKLPSIGTSIKPQTPITKLGNVVRESKKGESVTNYGLVEGIRKADKTANEIKEAIARSERSAPETQANLEAEYQSAMANMDSGAEDRAINQKYEDLVRSQKTLDPKTLSMLRADLEAIKANPSYPTATPTPTPMQGSTINSSGQNSGISSRSSSSSNQSSGGQVKGVSTIAPKILMSSSTNSQASNYRPSSTTQSIAPKQTQSKSTPAKSSPSIGTVIGGGALQAIKKIFGF